MEEKIREEAPAARAGGIQLKFEHTVNIAKE
jgi:hypothetical protein